MSSGNATTSVTLIWPLSPSTAKALEIPCVKVPAGPTMSTCVSTLPSRLPVPLSATNCSKSYWVNVVGHVRASQYGAAESRESANAATGNSTRRHSNPKAARFMIDLPLIRTGNYALHRGWMYSALLESNLFVPKRFDRMEGSGFPGRVRAEADADRGADHEAGDGPEPWEDHVHAEEE